MVSDPRPIDEVSLGELSRNITLLREDIRADIETLYQELRTLHGSFVPLARYEPELAGLRTSHADIIAAAKSDRERQERLRLLVLGSLVFPIVLIILAAVVTATTR